MPTLNEQTTSSVIGPIKVARIWWLDATRGGAVIAMIGYHLMWDLDAYSICAMPRWEHYIQMLIASSFLLLSGYSIAAFPSKVSHQIRRLTILGGAAMGITIASAALIPRGVITFGILHLISLCSLVLLFLRRTPGVLIALAIVLLASQGFTRRYMIDGFVSRCIGFHQAWSYSTADYFPIVPWAAPMFAGAAVGNWWPPRNGHPYRNEIFSMIGRHSLLFYLCHQPIILGILWFFTASRR